MARKSRKNLVNMDNKNVGLNNSSSKEEKIFKTAIYTRLSVENSGKSEDKDVMKNQIEYCKDYINDKTDLKLVDIYIDDGYTGTNFNRPEFNRLMEDIKQNKVDAIVIRDLSRFARSYIETGVYIENILPSIGVRLISINENFDSFTTDKSNEALMIPLQNMINEFYSKDISRKVSTAFRTRMENGVFKNSNVPYGYMWNEDKSKLIIDEEVAKYIKLIFRWKLDGVSKGKMIYRLKEMNAPNPQIRKNDLGVRVLKNKEAKEEIGWYLNTINGILSNPVYIGDTHYGKTYKAIYKGVTKTMKSESSDMIIFKNTHDAIISREDFEKVQEIKTKASEDFKRKTKESEKIRNSFINLFKGKIYCGDCGKSMFYRCYLLDNYKDRSRKNWRATYICSSHSRKLNTTCSTHNIGGRELQEKVLNAIKLQVKVGIDYENLLIKLKNSEGEKNVKEKQRKAISSLKLRISSVQKKRARLYEDFIEGLLDESEYKFTKINFDEEFNSLNEMLEEMISRQILFSESLNANNKWIKVVKSVSKAKKLTQAVVDNVIEEVRIYEDKKIEIVMKYDDIYRLMVESVEEVLEEENGNN